MAAPRHLDDYRQLTGSEKAAILLLAVGEESASKVFAMMDDEEIKELSLVMAGLGTVNANVIEQLIVEFAEQMGQSKDTPYGSVKLLPAGEDVPGRESTRIAENQEVLRWSIWVKDGGAQSKGFALEFDLGLAPGAIDATWRR